jgi:hypothetical protein
MRVDPRTLRKLALISVWICAGLDVLPVGEKDVLGHRLHPLGAVDLKRDFSSDDPRRQNEIGVTRRVIRVQVRRTRKLVGSRARIPLSRAAAFARRTTPGPKSTK